MFKFSYRLRRSSERTAPTASRGGDDPFAYPEIAKMDLRMLADLPPEQLREGVEGVKKPEAGLRVR